MGIGKLSRRLFLLTLIALIPAAAVLFYNLYSIRMAKEAEMQGDAMRAGQLASLEMQRIISGAENVLIALSAAPVIQTRDSAACQAYLEHVGARLPQFSGIAVADIKGDIVCRQTDEGLGISLADRPYFQQALKTGNFFVGEYSVGRVSDQPILPLALPIKGDGGETLGVIIGGLSLDWLNQRLGERDFAQKSALAVADRTGTLIARVPDSKKFVGTKVMERYRRFVTAERPGTFEAIGRDGIDRILGYYPASPASNNLFVSAGLSTDEAYQTIRRASWISLFATLASLLLSFLLAWLTSTELIRRPVGKLTATIRDWRSGDEDARTGMSERSGEFGVVGGAIDDFLGELVTARQVAARAEAQRELLVKELDHRIKNLLATVQSLARQTFKDTPHLEDTVAGFSRRLAAMSEAHGLLMKDDWRSADIFDVVSASVRPFVNISDPEFDISGPNFPLRAKAVLSLSMALHELCTNAVKYGALKTGEGRIAIEWTTEAGSAEEGEVLRFVWTEHGGPAVATPEKFGFGSKMIERVLGYELEASVETLYAETGVVCTLLVPLDRIRARERGR